MFLKSKRGGANMKATRENAYTPEQLANAEKMFKLLSALPEEKQNAVAMIANAFMEGMKAQERISSIAGA